MIDKNHWLVRYAFALVLGCAGMLLRLALTSIVGPGLPTYITFYPFVMLSALLAGVGPGVLTTIASAVFADYWLLMPQGLFVFDNDVDAVGWVFFIGMGTFMSYVAGRYRQIRDNLEKRVKERTKDLSESETRLKRSQEIAHLGSWELDLANNKLTWSDEVYRIFGLRPQEFGATYEAFLERVHADDRAAVDAAYSSSLSEGRDSYDIEHRVVRKDSGEIRYVHERCHHARDASGRVVRSIGMVHDITERKLAEEAREKMLEDLAKKKVSIEKLAGALRKEGDKVKAIMENAGTQLAYLDTKFNFVKVNSAFVAGSDFSADDLVGRNYFKMFPDKETQAIFEEAVSTGKPLELKARPLEPPDHPELGTTYWDWTIVPVKNPKGHVEGIVVSLTDVTEAQKTENLRARLLRDLSHQLKTPLSVIQMATGLLSSEVEKCEKGRKIHSESIEMIGRNTEEMKKMVSGILRLSLLESGQVKASPEDFDVVELVKGVLDQLKPVAKEKKLELTLDSPKELAIRSDREKLKDAVSNIMENAVKYTDKGQVNVSVARNGGKVEIAVSDTGRGLTKKQMGMLFTKFYKVDPSVPGTGLGLSIAKENVSLIGGEITASSRGLGKGSTFKITFKYDSETRAEA